MLLCKCNFIFTGQDTPYARAIFAAHRPEKTAEWRNFFFLFFSIYTIINALLYTKQSKHIKFIFPIFFIPFATRKNYLVNPFFLMMIVRSRKVHGVPFLFAPLMVVKCFFLGFYFQVGLSEINRRTRRGCSALLR